jgi:aerobic-type carbon monoxide dehydrogenase small subunit (CoxS/CutS family)
MPDYTLRVNGASHSVRTDADTPLFYVLRNDLDLNSPEFGCELAQCGACTVIIDGKVARSCVTPCTATAGKPDANGRVTIHTGNRLRDLPFTPERVKTALA